MINPIKDSFICSFPHSLLPSSTQLFIYTFTHSPLTHSLIHTVYQAPLGHPIHIFSAPPLTPAITVVTVLHRLQSAWCACHLELHHFRPTCVLSLPAQSFPHSVTWATCKDPRGMHTCATHSAGASMPRRQPLDNRIRKPLGKCSPPGQTILKHILHASQRSLGIKQSVTHSNDIFSKETLKKLSKNLVA